MNRAYDMTARDAAKFATRHAATAASEGRDFLDTKRKYAYKLGKQMQRAYPTLVSNLSKSARANAEQAKKLLRTHGHEAAEAAGGFYRQGVNSIEFKLLKAGAIYALWRYLSRNPKVHEVTERVKAEVKAEPVKSAVIALGIGLLVGRILG